MPRNYDKRRTVDTIAPLLACGFNGVEISRRTGIAISYVYRLIRTLGLQKGNNCPHCGRDTRAALMSDENAGEVRPNES
jgi:hypothetical protein